MFSFPRFATHLLASLVLGAPLLVVSTGRVAATAAPLTVVTAASDYQQVTLAFGAPEMGEAMALAVLPDRSVLHTARDGTVRITDAQGNTNISGRIPVYDHDEDGLQGVGVDPNFAANRALYLYYSPPLSTPGTDAPANGTAAAFAPFAGVNRLSRFILNANGTLNMASEKAILEVRTDRGMCCHNGGDIDFDAAGNLYLSTGDDTNPYQSDGYSPLDERTDRYPAFDAQRSAANTNDLRGKVLRIKVNVDGSYSIPPGNLFAPGTAGTRPEIYAMGLRNPFRMSVDKATGILYLGDFGPDAGVADPNRGPGGQVEVDRITSAGNYGWPYCTGTNTTAETYNHFDFATEVSGPKYNCAAPVNTSPRNTGLVNLPPARPSWIKYGDAGSPPEFGSGSESPMGGPVYRYDAANPSPVKFPQSLDGVYFAGEYGRQWIKTVEVNADGTPGCDRQLPMARYPGHGPGVRPGWRALRARLRHRLRADGQLGALPHRVFTRRPGADRSCGGRPDIRDRPAAGGVLVRREQRPRRRAVVVRVELRRRRDLQRGQPGAHVRHQRAVHGDADGHRRHRQDRNGRGHRHGRKHRPDGQPHAARGRPALLVR